MLAFPAQLPLPGKAVNEKYFNSFVYVLSFFVREK